MLNVSEKRLKTLIKQFACSCAQLSIPIRFLSRRLFQNLMLECLHFSPIAGFLKDDEWMQEWLVRCLVFCSPLRLRSSTNTYSVMCYD